MKNIIETLRDQLSLWMLPETHAGPGPVAEQRAAYFAADWAVHEALRSELPDTWSHSTHLQRTPRVTSVESSRATSGHLNAMTHMLHSRSYNYLRVFRCLDTVTRPRLCLAHVADVARALENEELAELLLRGMVGLT